MQCDALLQLQFPFTNVLTISIYTLKERNDYHKWEIH